MVSDGALPRQEIVGSTPQESKTDDHHQGEGKAPQGLLPSTWMNQFLTGALAAQAGLPSESDSFLFQINRHFPDNLQVCGDHIPVPPSRELYSLCSHPMA